MVDSFYKQVRFKRNKCLKCDKSDCNLKICVKCGFGKYCSRECQVADWSSHKYGLCMIGKQIRKDIQDGINLSRNCVLLNDAHDDYFKLELAARYAFKQLITDPQLMFMVRHVPIHENGCIGIDLKRDSKHTLMNSGMGTYVLSDFLINHDILQTILSKTADNYVFIFKYKNLLKCILKPKEHFNIPELENISSHLSHLIFHQSTDASEIDNIDELTLYTSNPGGQYV